MRPHEHDSRFELFGTRVRLLVGEPAEDGLDPAPIAALRTEAFLRFAHRALTRFEPQSELSRLNADPSERVEASALLAVTVRAARQAAERSGGLVDPTLVGEIEAAGYASSRVGVAPASLTEALAAAPARATAAPHPAARWREIEADLDPGVVRRPPGVRIDLGGIAKGLIADLAARRLEGYESFVVDIGGDMRVGAASPRPRTVEVEHPFGDAPAASLRLHGGAVATSGLARRVWRHGEGFSHHVLDPATGLPAWTGVIQATALADTAGGAEELAKRALLGGPERGAELLAEGGGVLVLDDGAAVVAGDPGERLAVAA